MGRKSTIKQLDKRVREAVDAAIREDRATIDELVEIIEQHGGEASRSAVGRYVKRTRDAMQHFRQAQALAKTWAEKIPENGDVAALSRQLLSTAAFRAAADLQDGEKVEGKEVMLMARALKDIAAAAKTDAEARAKIRAEVAAELVEKVDQAAGGKAMSPAEIKAVIREAYGV